MDFEEGEPQDEDDTYDEYEYDGHEDHDYDNDDYDNKYYDDIPYVEDYNMTRTTLNMMLHRMNSSMNIGMGKRPSVMMVPFPLSMPRMAQDLRVAVLRRLKHPLFS